MKYDLCHATSQSFNFLNRTEEGTFGAHLGADCKKIWSILYRLLPED